MPYTQKIQIFAGEATKSLAEKIANEYDQELGSVIFERFSDGEYQPNILESVRGSTVFFIQSTNPPVDNLFELLMLIDAAKRASAAYVVVVMPYFGFSRQDRKDKPRVSIGAKLVANLLVAAGADRVMTMDLHAPQIQGFFDIPVDHLDNSAIFIPYIESLKLDNILFAAPDIGSSKRVRAFAKKFSADIIICDKYRKRANEIAEMRVIGDAKGRDVIIIDDIIDTGNTLCTAAEKLFEKGANSVRAMCTHPILSGNAYARIENSLLEELVVCDTIPIKQKTNKINVLSVAPLFANAIKCVNSNNSISNLFI